MLHEKICSGGTGGQFVDFAVGGVADVERFVGADREVVAGAVFTGEVPADFLRAGGEIEASEGGVTLYRCCAGDGG